MKIKTFLNFFVFVNIALLLPSFVLAGVDKLVVEFEKTPLFSEANFLPGHQIQRWTKITNNDIQSHKIIVEAINKVDPNNFSQQLNLIIKEGASTLYNNSLKSFFETGEHELSNLAGNGGKTQYDFYVSFNPLSGNDYQEKTLSFDFLIGFQGDEGESEENSTSTNPEESGGTTYGSIGGGSSLPPGLTILDESVTTTVSAQCFATIYWNTTYFSTTQIVFSQESESHNFDLLAPNYGYSHSQEGDDSGQPKVTGHKITLYGLTPNATYYYRAISHASPATISRQYSFVMCPCLEQKLIQEPQNQEVLAFDNSPKARVLGESQEIILNDISTTTEQTTAPVLLANIGSFFNNGFKCLKCLPWWITGILVLLSIQKTFWLIKKFKKETEKKPKKKLLFAFSLWLMISLVSLGALIFFYLTRACFLWWIIIVFLLCHIVIYQFLIPVKPEKKKRANYFTLAQIAILILAIVWGVFAKCLPVWLIFIILAIIFVNNKKEISI